MDYFDVQLMAALVCVALAAGWLGWRAVCFVRGTSRPGCGTCGQCPASSRSTSEQAPAGFVSLDQLRQTLPPQ